MSAYDRRAIGLMFIGTWLMLGGLFIAVLAK